jgi:hypothetical protein
MQKPPKRRILVGLWTFPISGGMALTALYLRKFVNLPVGDITEWANSVTSRSYLIAQYLYILAYVVPFFGFWALYVYLAEKQKERLAFWGLMGALIGTGLPLTTLGVLAYASPAIGRLYLQGDTQLPQVINEISMGSSMVMGMPGAFLYVGGCVAFGVAVWQSGTINKWTGVMMALHGLLVAFGFGMPLLLVLSWIFLVVSGMMFIIGVRKDDIEST